ncbi:MAG: hypothetical protein ABIG91_02535 [Patescibacteria group bacterium]
MGIFGKSDYRRPTGNYFLGIILILFFGIGDGLGLRFQVGFISYSLDKLIAFGVFQGMVCAHIAYKKNKNPDSAFFAGIFLGPIAVIYYLFCKRDMSKEEKELHDWELGKKYQKMVEEKLKQQ